MSGCSGVDTVCQLLAWITDVVDIKVTLVLTITAYVSWSVGYEKGRSDAGCNKKDYCEGFINGIMFLMVKFKAKANVSFDLVFEKDPYITEAICRIGKSTEYKMPPGSGGCQ
jgi:hypothetical protein